MHLDRLITLLELIAVAGRPIAPTELQKVTGLPKPTCYRLIQTLQDHRLVQSPDDTDKVEIGERLIRIALLGKADVDVRKASASLLRPAAIKYNETVFLARFRNSKVEIIHVETPVDPAPGFIHPGLGERPMHVCSCSKAVAAFSVSEFQDCIVSKNLRQYTDHTKASQAEVYAEFKKIVERGFADCDQEIDMGIASIAEPVSVGNIGAIFSVGAVGPIRRFGQEYQNKIGLKLIELSTRMSGLI